MPHSIDDPDRPDRHRVGPHHTGPHHGDAGHDARLAPAFARVVAADRLLTALADRHPLHRDLRITFITAAGPVLAFLTAGLTAAAVVVAVVFSALLAAAVWSACAQGPVEAVRVLTAVRWGAVAMVGITLITAWGSAPTEDRPGPGGSASTAVPFAPAHRPPGTFGAGPAHAAGGR